jgi:hypothetical protein
MQLFPIQKTPKRSEKNSRTPYYTKENPLTLLSSIKLTATSKSGTNPSNVFTSSSQLSIHSLIAPGP